MHAVALGPGTVARDASPRAVGTGSLHSAPTGGSHSLDGAVMWLGEACHRSSRSVIALAGAVNQAVFARLLGHEIDLAVTAEAGVVARHIVARDDGCHIVGEVIELQRAVLGREQQAVARAVEHGEIGGSLNALEQARQGGHLDLLSQRCRQQGHQRQHHNDRHFLFHIYLDYRR